jgi:RNAse (barnase) inhibitor barstar
MYTDATFDYTSDTFTGEEVVIRGSEIRSRDELFDVIAEKLSFPDYFGRNWDALVDCLSDLFWVDQDRVILAHAGLPLLDRANLRKYLQCLHHVLERRTNSDHPMLIVLFQEEDRPEIARILSELA